MRLPRTNRQLRGTWKLASVSWSFLLSDAFPPGLLTASPDITSQARDCKAGPFYFSDCIKVRLKELPR